jgi:hypothetical protein
LHDDASRRDERREEGPDDESRVHIEEKKV